MSMRRKDDEFRSRGLTRRGFLQALASAGALVLAGCAEALPGIATPTPVQTREPASQPMWRAGPDMPDERAQVEAVTLAGELYVIGGITPDGPTGKVAVYNPDDEAWHYVQPLPEALDHTTAVVHAGKIYVVGGFAGFFGGGPLDTVWIYDPEADAWEAGAPMLTARGAMGLGVIDGRIYAAGGQSEAGTVPTLEIYDIAADTWEAGKPMPVATEHLASDTIDGKLYLAGGRQGFSPMLDTTQVYDPESDMWEELVPMPMARGGIDGTAYGGRLYVFGGEEVSVETFDDVDAYGPSTDSWGGAATHADGALRPWHGGDWRCDLRGSRRTGAGPGQLLGDFGDLGAWGQLTDELTRAVAISRQRLSCSQRCLGPRSAASGAARVSRPPSQATTSCGIEQLMTLLAPIFKP